LDAVGVRDDVTLVLHEVGREAPAEAVEFGQHVTPQI
jgi:hypothetical protein